MTLRNLSFWPNHCPMKSELEKSTFQEATAHGFCYFYYRAPGEPLRVGQAPHPVKGLYPGGFVIWPFDNDEDNIFTIPSTNVVETGIIEDTNLRYPLPEESTHRERHLSNVAEAVSSHRLLGQGKTVISRVIKTSCEERPLNLFRRLEKAYPDAYIFLFHTPQTGTWIGATPELLLSSDGENIRTMALAGTKSIDDSRPWDIKNTEEQEIVADFMDTTMRKHGLAPVRGKTVDRMAGVVKHICTPLHAPLPDDWNEQAMALLLRDLSPTPALGGYPRTESLSLINRLEQHKRGYYGGFIGYMADCTHFSFFVNLRSARLSDRHIYLYVGGGITSRSIPEDEWIETERKSQTLLRIVNERR